MSDCVEVILQVLYVPSKGIIYCSTWCASCVIVNTFAVFNVVCLGTGDIELCRIPLLSNQLVAQQRTRFMGHLCWLNSSVLNSLECSDTGC